MSELALQRIREAKQHRLTRLDLGMCGLTELPDELFELTWLEELYLSNEWDEYALDNSKWEKVKSQNKGEQNKIKQINPKIVILRELKILILNGKFNYSWDLNDLNPLKGLLKLQRLEINYTRVTELERLFFLDSNNIFFTLARKNGTWKSRTYRHLSNLSNYLHECCCLWHS